MAYTWGEILTDVRNQVNETTAAFFTDDYIMEQWNHYQLDFVKRVRLLKKEVELTFQSDDQTVNLPSDFLMLIQVAAKDSDDNIVFVQPTSLEGRAVRSRMPATYTLNNYAATPNLKMTEEYTDSEVPILVYIAKPTPFANSALTAVETDIPDEYISSIEFGVVMQCTRKRRELEDAREYERLYRESIQSAIMLENTKMGHKKTIMML